MSKNYARGMRWRRLGPLLATAALLASSIASTPANAQTFPPPQLLPTVSSTFTVNVNDDNVGQGSDFEPAGTLQVSR